VDPKIKTYSVRPETNFAGCYIAKEVEVMKRSRGTLSLESRIPSDYLFFGENRAERLPVEKKSARSRWPWVRLR
jgi:hypothetical protein